MNRLKVLIIGLAALAVAGGVKAATRPALRLQTITFQGWTGCMELVAGPYRLVVAPSIGGRIVEYSMNGAGPIWLNPNERGKVHPLDPKVWHNYGGYKTWPAPQSVWGWPPDPQLDGGPAQVTPWRQNGKLIGLRIEGKPSPGAGIAFEKRLRLDPASGALTLWQSMTALKSNTKPVRWGVWDITQVNANGWVVTPLNPKSRHKNGVYFYGPEAEKSRQWKVEDGRLIIQNRGDVAKYGADTNGGWMVWLRDRQAYLKRYPRMIAGQEYPDQYSTAQIYTNDPKLPYTEMEIAGPLVDLKPGETTTLVEEWRLLPLPRPVRSGDDIAAAIRHLESKRVLQPVE